MSLLSFTIYTSESPIARPKGSTYNWTVRINTLTPLIPRRIGKTTMSISGKSGETRVRGSVVSGTIAIPRIVLAELPIAREFASAMVLGFGSPFYLDATDCFGIHRTLWGVVTDDITPIANESCREWSMTIPFTEISAP